MERVQITGTGLDCSRIALGTWSMGGTDWGGSDDQESLRTLRDALTMGINVIDTAPIYGHGHSEELVGQALAEHGRRDQVIVATKFGLDWSGGRIARNSSDVRREVETSLRRLRTDYVDIYQVHWPDTSIRFASTAAEMERLRGEGKVRALGVSNFSAQQMEEFRQAAPLHTSQPPFNVFERDAEREVLPYCRAHQVAVLAYGALCRGLLSGRMREDTRFGENDVRLEDPKFQPPRYAQYLEAVVRLDRFAQQNYGKRVVHLAVRWLLEQPGVDIALWGARRPQQLEAVAGVMGWSLDDSARREIDRILRETIKDPVGPEFLAPPESTAA